MKHLQFIFILGLLQLISLPLAFGHSIELTFAGNTERYDSGDFDYGLSSRIRYAHYAPMSPLPHLSMGPLLQISFPGSSLTQFDGIAGVGARYGQNFFGELAAGIRYSTVYGAGAAVVIGGGFRPAERWLVSLPITWRIGYSTEYTPYVGYEF